MAESSSTGSNGNGGTGNGSNGNGNGSNGNGNGGTGTTGNGTGGTTSTTSTSTSNSGPAAPGSQTSSNGSFSTGNGNGNSGNGSNGNGNFSGGLPGFMPGYTGLASDNFGQGWGKGSHTITPGPDGKHTITPGPDGKHTIHQPDYSKPNSASSTNNSHYITVDEVYGNGVYGNLNQSIIENQGDYEATSNEKSNVETSTFGKQDEISVTPTSVTEDKGLVNNDAIQSVEGLNFQQKDKANQDVMEAKKSRDETEAEDNANGMRDQLKAVAEKDAEEDNNAFQVGEENEGKEKAAFIEAEKAYKDIEAKVAEKEAELAKAEKEFNDLDNAWFEVHQPRLNAAKDALNDVIAAATRDNEENGRTDPTYDISYLAEVAAEPENYADAAKVVEQLNEAPGLQGNKYLSEIKQCVTDVARVSKDFYEVSQKHEEAQQRYNQLTYELADLMDSKEKAETAYNKAKESYDATFIAENPTDRESKDVANAKAEVDRLDKQIAEKDAEYEAARKEEAGIKDAAFQAQVEFAREFGDPESKDFNETATISVLASKPALFEKSKSKLANYAAKHGVEIGDISEISAGDFIGLLRETQSKVNMHYESLAEKANDRAVQAWKDSRDLTKTLEKSKQEYDALMAANPVVVENAKTEEAPVVTPEPKAEEAVTAEAPSYKANIDAAKNEINNSKDLTDEQKAEATSVLGNVETAAEAVEKAASDLAANPNDINAAQKYVEETARYNKALKDAKGNKTLKNTNFNKTFAAAVAAANDFMVTREDGTQQNYAEFAAEMATKSPELAKGLYEAKAARLAEDGHKVLAAIENAKAKMVTTWLGSKFTFADNQVRSQFNQMAKTDMRATYAAYNNVLNDETGKYSEADKAEASAALNQANSLMTASAALQASTGFLSGIGDGTSDGVYGKTDPGSLNGYQKALNAASNFAKIALGLGVTPGANEAYQNMYYMAGAKVNESGLFSKDFDGDGFALCQEYGNNAAVGMIAGAGELATGVALMFNPATSKIGINLAIDAVQTFLDGLYGVQKEVNKSIKYSSEILNYFKEAESIAAETGNKEAIGTIDSAIKRIEDFQLKSDEVGNLDNWLEGSGSNTADNGKFNQALTYDEWLKLIEADPVMREYAKSLNR